MRIFFAVSWLYVWPLYANITQGGPRRYQAFREVLYGIFMEALDTLFSFPNRARMIFTRPQLFWKALAHGEVRGTSEQESATPKTRTLPLFLPRPTKKVSSHKLRSLRMSEWPKSEATVFDIGEVLHTSTLIPIDTTDTYLKKIINLFFLMLVFTPNMALIFRLRLFPFCYHYLKRSPYFFFLNVILFLLPWSLAVPFF